MLGHQLALLAHVAGFTAWLVGLLGSGWILASIPAEAPAEIRQALAGVARRIAILADGGATVAVLAGLYMLHVLPFVLRTPWMQLKLTLVAGLLAAHIVIRVRGKRMGSASAGLVAAAAAVALGVMALVLLKVPVAW